MDDALAVLNSVSPALPSWVENSDEEIEESLMPDPRNCEDGVIEIVVVVTTYIVLSYGKLALVAG